jgi:hypothetical protein
MMVSRAVSKLDASTVGMEFIDNKLGDARLSARLQSIVRSVAVAPEKSFPSVLRDEAELEAFYRFINNDRVRPKQIIEPHLRQSFSRVAALSTVIVAHDSSDFAFAGSADRDGLSQLRKRSQGFSGHFAFAVAPHQREPLGVLGYSTHFRQKKAKKLSRRFNHCSPDNESRRWNDLVDDVELKAQIYGVKSKLIHVMDREADSYSLMAILIEQSHRFIIRMTKDRNVISERETSKASQLISTQPVMLTREISLSRRDYARKNLATDKAQKRYPPRPQRIASLSVQAKTVALPATDYVGSDFPKTISVNIVWVEEKNPPEGQEPVLWKLITTEPIATPDDLEAIIDGYRARWRIEEFFKALKTGCAYQERQMESAGSLLNVLAICVPIAACLLRLRDLASDASRLASDVFEPCECDALRAMVLAQQHVRLPETLTLDRALRAIARFGGYIKKNERPGWQTLWSGYTEWQAFVGGWRAANAQKYGTYGSDRT